MPVIAGPTEATAIGNIMMQAAALNVVDSLSDIRRIISQSVKPVTFMPQDSEIWEKAYIKFNEICTKK